MLLRLSRAVDLLRDALDLGAGLGGGAPDATELVERADVEADLLAQVLLVLEEVDGGPLAQVHDGREREHAGEEMRVAHDGHVVRHHPADGARRRDDVARVQVEVVAARHVAVGRAGRDLASRRRVELRERLVEHDGAAFLVKPG